MAILVRVGNEGCVKRPTPLRSVARFGWTDGERWTERDGMAETGLGRESGAKEEWWWVQERMRTYCMQGGKKKRKSQWGAVVHLHCLCTCHLCRYIYRLLKVLSTKVDTRISNNGRSAEGGRQVGGRQQTVPSFRVRMRKSPSEVSVLRTCHHCRRADLTG